MKFLKRLAMAGLLATIAYGASAQDTEIVLSELLNNPGGTDNGSRVEWIEFYNRGNIAVDLSGYKCNPISTTTTRDVIFPAGTIIDPKGFLIVTGNKEVMLGYHYKRLDPSKVINANWPRESVINNSSPAIKLYRPGQSTPFLSPSLTNGTSGIGDDLTYEIIDPTQPMALSNYRISPNIYGSPGRPNTASMPEGVTITNSTRDKQYPSPSDSISVTANVNTLTTSPAIASVQLYVNTGSGFVANAMTNTSGNTYAYTIPAQADGTLVKHYIKVTDVNGKTMTYPAYDGWEAFMVDDNFPTDQDLVINEIMYNPLGDDNLSNSEWIEVYNRRSTPIDMSYFMWGNHTETPNARILPEGFTIPGNGYAIFAGDKALFQNQYPLVTAPIADAQWTSGSILSNSNADPGGQDTPLVHCNAVDWNDTRVPLDVVPYRVASPWPTSTDGLSIQLKSPELDNTVAANWLKSAYVGAASPASLNYPVSISVGSGEGSLSFTSSVYPNGYIAGDTGQFYPKGGSGASNTLWRNNFMVYNVTNDAVYWADPIVSHAPKVPDGTVTKDASSVTNTGIPYGNSLTGDLKTQLSELTAGESVRMEFQWKFYNAAASPKTVRVIWFYDGDSYHLGSNYNDDLALRVANTMATGPAIAVGEGIADTSVSGVTGVLAECSIPVKVFGVNDLPSGTYGSSYYWSNGGNYAGNGPEVLKGIAPSNVNKVQNDGNDNGAADSPGDCGAVLQADFAVPASGSYTLTFRATYGVNTTYTPIAGVNDWNLY